jgi:hypothetical protein
MTAGTLLLQQRYSGGAVGRWQQQSGNEEAG